MPGDQIKKGHSKHRDMGGVKEDGIFKKMNVFAQSSAWNKGW